MNYDNDDDSYFIAIIAMVVGIILTTITSEKAIRYIRFRNKMQGCGILALTWDSCERTGEGVCVCVCMCEREILRKRDTEEEKEGGREKKSVCQYEVEENCV